MLKHLKLTVNQNVLLVFDFCMFQIFRVKKYIETLKLLPVFSIYRGVKTIYCLFFICKISHVHNFLN